MPDLFHWLLDRREVQRDDRRQHEPVLQSRRAAAGRPSCSERFGLPTAFLGRIEQPGTKLGPLRASVAAETGLQAEVVLPGSHDTASAVMAVPAHSRPGQRPDWCYISLGTWALMGVESPGPVINDKVLQLELHQRRRGRQHDPAVEEHCRPVADAGMPADLEPGGRDWNWEDLNRLSAAAPPLRFVHQSRRRRVPGPRRHAARRFAISAGGRASRFPATKARCSAAPWTAWR